jgi:tetratricopeptide (TPR) repeat protein
LNVVSGRWRCYSGAVDDGLRGDVASALHVVEDGRGLYIMTASTGIQAARETEPLPNGVVMGRFTADLVNGIKTGAADQRRRGEILLSDLHYYLGKTVTGSTPQFFSRKASSDPLISLSPATAAPLLDAEVLADLDSEQAHRRHGAVSVLSKLLRDSDETTRAVVKAELQRRLGQERDYNIRAELESALLENVSAPGPPPTPPRNGTPSVAEGPAAATDSMVPQVRPREPPLDVTSSSSANVTTGLRLPDANAAFGEAEDLESGARALLNKGVELSRLDRSEEAIAVYDDLLTRFGGATELPLRELVAYAIYNKGITLATTPGRPEEAIAVFDDLLARFKGATELPLRELVAQTLYTKGSTLATLGGPEEAIVFCDELLALFGSATELPLRELVAQALVQKGSILATLSRREEAIAIYDGLLKRLEGATELPLRELVAQALVQKGVSLGALGRRDKEIAVYDDVLARFGSVTELPMRELVAQALVNKGASLGALGRREREISVYNGLLKCLEGATELPLRELVAQTLYNKESTLATLGRREEAIAVCDILLERFRGAIELPLRELVVQALFDKASMLAMLGRRDKAIDVLNDIIVRIGDSTELPSELVTRATASRARLLSSWRSRGPI